MSMSPSEAPGAPLAGWDAVWMAIGDLLLEGGDATEVDSIANGVSPFLFTADGDQTRTETRDGRTVTLLVDDADVAVNVARHWANALLGAERARRGLVEAHATLGARAFDLDVVTTAATEMVAALDASAHFVHVRHDSPWHLRWKMLGAAALAGCEESLLRRLLALLAPGLLEAVWKMAGSAGERLLGLERRGFRDVCSGHVCGWTATAVADRCSLAFDSAVLGEVSEKDSHVDDHPRLLALAAASLASAVSSEVARDLLRDVDVDKLMDLATMAPDDRRRRVPCVHLVTSALDAWVEARGAVATGEELALMRRGALLLIAVAPPFNDGLRQVVEVIAKHPCLRGHGASNDAQCLADLLEIVIDLRIRHGPGVAPSALSPHADEFLHSASAARVPGPSALRGRGRGGARQPAARGVGRGRGRGSGRGGARLGPRTPAPVDASAMTAGRVTFSGHLDPAYLMRIVRNGLDAPPGAMTVVGEDEEAKRRAVGRVTRLIRTDYLATFADWVLRLHGAVPRAAEWDTSTGDWTAMSHMALTRGGHQRGVPLRLCDFKLRCVPLRQGSPAAQEGAVQDVDTIEREQWCKFYFTVDGERPGRGRQDCKGCSHCINVAPFFAPGDSVRLLRVTKAGQSSAPGSTCGGSASPDGRGGTSQAQGGDHVIDLGAFLDEVDAAFDRVREAHPYYGGRRMKDEVKQEIVREGFGTVPGESWTEDPFTWLEHASEHDSGAPGLEGKVEAWGRTKAGHMGAEISLRFDEDFWTGMGREKWEKLLTEGEWIVTGGINTKTVKTLAFAALHLAERENETVDVAPFKCCRKAVDMEAMQENDSSEDDDLRDVESDSEGSACERMDLGEHLEAVEAQTRRKYFNAPVAMGVAAAEAVQRACARLGRRELGRALARGSLSTITDDERAARLGAEQSLRSVLIRAALAEHPDAPGGGGSGDEPRGQRPGTGDTLQNEDILSRTAGRRKVMDDDDFMGCSDDDSVNGLDETDGADGRPLWATREWMGEVDRALEGMDGSDREHRKIIRETLGHFLSLVHGPPGTGKTHTIVAMIRAAVGATRAMGGGGPGPILVATETNDAAVDIAARCAETCPSMKVVLLNPKNAPEGRRGERHISSVVRSTPFYHTAAEINRKVLAIEARISRLMAQRHDPRTREYIRTLRKALRKLKKVRELTLEQAETEALRSAEVVVCTAAAAGDRCILRTFSGRTPEDPPTHVIQKKCAIDPGMGFRLVILEEAAQQALPNALVALTRGAEAAVLVGDSRQLPPVANNISRDHVRSFEWGLFPRLEILQAAESHRLTRQHRMPPELSAFISGHFYPDFSLSNAPTVKEHALVSLDDVRRVKVPAFGLGSRDALVSVHVPRVKGLHGSTEPRVVAVHVDGTMQQAGTSKENWKEGAVVAALVLKLLSGDAGSRWIAVLAYHVPQVTCLEKAIERALKHNRPDLVQSTASRGAALPDNVVVRTVDKFQGQEADVVILSTTLSDTQGPPDSNPFVLRPNRVNVSLSRARCLCVLVGHLEALASKREGGGPEWRKARGLSGASGDSDSWGHHWRHFVEHVGRMGQRVDAEVLEAE